jgi:hypothetical protein
VDGRLFQIAQAAGPGQFDILASTGDYVIRTQSTVNKLFITNGPTTPGLCLSNGKLGANNANPLALIDIKGGHGNTGIGGQPLMAFQYWNEGGYRHWITTRHEGGPSVSGNSIDFWINNAAPETASSTPGTGNTRILSITGAGVGISNANPSAALDIVGNMKQSRRDYQRAGMYTASSSNYIICYSNVIANNLSGYITYNANSSTGDSWTVNKSGVYTVQYNFWVQTSGTTFHVIDRNDATANFSPPTQTSAILLAFGSRNNYFETNISWTGYLAVNDVVRCKSQGLGTTSFGPASVWITMIYEC